MHLKAPPGARTKANALPPAAIVAREGFKATNKLSEVIAAAHNNRHEIMRFKSAVKDGLSLMRERDTVGMAIRSWDKPVGSWRVQVLSAMLVDAMQSLKTWGEAVGSGQFSYQYLSEVILTDSSAAERDLLCGWQAFLDRLADLDICEAPSLKRLLDGKTLAKALGVKPGVWTGQALDACVAWQLRNPSGTDPAGAIEEIRRRREELGVPSNE